MCSLENTVAAAAGVVVAAFVFVAVAIGETGHWHQCERTDVMLRLEERVLTEMRGEFKYNPCHFRVFGGK